MTERKHTPGPWMAKAGLNRWNVTTTTRPRTDNICSINNERIEQEANARLIAAAPDMLEALEVLLNATMYKDHPAESDIAIAAIAKAKGDV